MFDIAKVRNTRDSLPSFFIKEVRRYSPDLHNYYIMVMKYNNFFIEFNFENEVLYLLRSPYYDLARFGERHNIKNELLLLLKEGYLDGRKYLHHKCEEILSIHSSDGVKAYLVSQITGHNKGSFKKTFDNRIEFDIEHDPFLIREFAFKNAMYFEAWVEIFKMHRLYNEEFSKLVIELHKRRSEGDFVDVFPKRYVKNINLPDSVQCAVDLNKNINLLLNFLNLKYIPNKDSNLLRPRDSIRMNPDRANKFILLCTEFLKEAANNHEKGSVNRNKKFYFETIHLAEQCLKLLKQPELCQGNRSMIEKFRNENWFVQVLNCLDNTIDSVRSNYPFIFESQDIEKSIDSKNSHPEETKAESIKETKFDIEQFIGFMNGKNPQKANGLILGETDYMRLVSYTKYLISEGKVPLEIIPMPKTNLNNQAIVYTFSLIHDHYINGKNTTKEYIVFIHKVFNQFNDKNIEIGNNYRKTTAYTKFREEPPSYKRLIRN